MKKSLMLIFITFSAVSFAEVLLIERVNTSTSIVTPNKGMTKAQVESQFGSPVSQKAAVGEPPISVWHYEEFSVYFEHSHVVHAVLKKASDNELGPKPIE
jgi:hypothetical protein